jgi:hypothetical protein
VIAAAFTAFYSWRLIFLTFFGAPRWGKPEHAHDPHASMCRRTDRGSAPLVGTGGHGPMGVGTGTTPRMCHTRARCVDRAAPGCSALGAVLAGG